MTDEEREELSDIEQRYRFGCDDWWDRMRARELLDKQKAEAAEPAHG